MQFCIYKLLINGVSRLVWPFWGAPARADVLEKCYSQRQIVIRWVEGDYGDN
jgi:hypothetical protein